MDVMLCNKALLTYYSAWPLKLKMSGPLICENMACVIHRVFYEYRSENIKKFVI